MNFACETSQQLASQSTKWWIGRIAKEETWCKNENRTKTDSVPGYGQRYRVRIVGKHDKAEIKDEELEMVGVIMPVTAGSGHMNSSQTATLRQGSVVIGITLDGEDGSEYLIVGTLPNQTQTELKPKPNPKNGFENVTGVGGDSYRKSDGRPVFGLKPGGKPVEVSDGSSDIIPLQSDDDQEKDGKKSSDLPTKRKCGGAEVPGIQLAMRDMIASIESAQKALTSAQDAINKKAQNIEKDVTEAINKATEWISGKMKSIIEEVRKNTLDLVQKKIKKQFGKIWPEDRPKLKKIQDKVWDKISCLFNKVIKGIKGIVSSLLKGLVGKAVNIPVCIAQNFAGGLLSQILGPLIALINNLLTPLLALLGIAGSLAGNILGLIKGLLGFFSCEEEEECPDLVTWSFWDGPGAVPGGQPKFDITSIFSAAMSFASGLKGVISDVASIDFGSVVNVASAVKSVVSGVKGCVPDPVKCGPPKIEFYGSLSAPKGNVITSAVGDVLGVDIVAPGLSSDEPFVSIVDDCRKGSGANAYPIMDPKNPTKVQQVVIESPGDGYLSRFDGSKGGDGRVWARPEQTIVKRSDSTWEPPYNPGQKIELLPGDQITIPDNAIIDYPTVIPPGIPITIQVPVTVIAPEPDPEIQLLSQIQQIQQPQKSNADSYGVILTLCNPVIQNGGINYSEGDQIVIEPNMGGAELEPVFGPMGNLEKINVINPGTGFDTWPTIYIDSETGFNAKILPNFCVNRVEELPKIPEGAKIVSVIDCVGRLIK